MTGQTRLIIRDLMDSVPIKKISEHYNVTLSAIYGLAKKYNVQREHISEEERKKKKKLADAIRNKEKREKSLLDPNTRMPDLPMIAAKFGPLSVLDGSWITGQGNKRSSHKGNEATQIRYGLRT